MRGYPLVLLTPKYVNKVQTGLWFQKLVLDCK